MATTATVARTSAAMVREGVGRDRVRVRCLVPRAHAPAQRRSQPKNRRTAGFVTFPIAFLGRSSTRRSERGIL